MKFYFLVLFLITISFNSKADFQLTIDEICSDNKIASEKIKANNISLGDFIVNYLDTNKIPFVGSKYGINTIKNSPVGDEALIVLNDHEMLAFGWCYKIDGIVSEKMPDEVVLDDSTMDVHWYYGFAHYFNGEWVSQCVENQFITRKIFCK